MASDWSEWERRGGDRRPERPDRLPDGWARPYPQPQDQSRDDALRGFGSDRGLDEVRLRPPGARPIEHHRRTEAPAEAPAEAPMDAPRRAAEAIAQGDKGFGAALRTSRRDGGRADAAKRPPRWRLSFKMNRKWKLGVFAPLGFTVAAAVYALPPVTDAVEQGLAALDAAARTQPALTIARVEIDGLNRLTEAEVLAALDLDTFGRYAPAFGLEEARNRIETRLDWARTARVSIAAPRVLRVEIVEKTPAALWRRNGRLRLLDTAGNDFATVARTGEWRRMPLLVGDGAPRAFDEAIALFARADAAELPIVGLTRLGGRRWDMELLDGPRVMLPETDPFTALDQLIEWRDRAQILSRDLEAIDLRLPHAPTVRMTPPAWKTRRDQLDARRDAVEEARPTRPEQGA